MKFNYNGNIVEIKVTPENSKKVNELLTEDLYNRITLAMIHAENFCTGNGMHEQASQYSEIAHSMMKKQI